MLLIGCGAAGAVSGIFKAPIAGLVFTLEVLMIDLTMASLLPLLVSCVTAASFTYLFNGTELEQLTRDHSVVQELLESGELTPDQAQNYPNRNLITRALGVAAELEADYTEYYLPKNYSILLCTDGVTNLVDGTELAGFMEKPPDEAVKSMIALAVERGGTDNATAVVISGNSMEG